MSNNNNNTNWISDGSEGSTIAVNDAGSEEVTATAGKKGTPFNVRYNSAINPTNSAYFSVTINELSGNVSVGLVSEDEFQPGWKTRGMFYNGNVTNGSASLITGFGKYLKAGDVIHVRKFKEQDKTVIQFVVNGKNLGTAFQLDDANGGNKTFYPCVHVSGTIKFVYKELEPSSADSSTSASNEGEAAAGFEGDWKLDKFEMDGSNVELPSEPPIAITLDGSPTPTNINIKVSNTIRGSMEVTGGTQTDQSVVDVKIGPMMSTMMMPRPPFDTIEPKISKSVPSVTKMSLVAGNLSMSGSGVEITASRYTKTFEPLTKYS